MKVSELTTLGEGARVWIFGSPERLDDFQRETVSRALRFFVNEWTAHGSPLSATFAVLEDHFLVVGVNPGVPPSGCSIDRLFRVMQELQTELGISLLDSDLLFYRDRTGRISAAPRTAFRELVKSGEVTGETPVFDLTVESASEVQRKGFEKRAIDSWHAGAFGIGASAPA